MKKIIIFSLFLFLVSCNIQKTNSITGIVVDNENETLTGVKISDGEKNVYSDLDGNFEIKTDKKTLTLSFISYEKKKKTIYNVKDSLLIVLNEV